MRAASFILTSVILWSPTFARVAGILPDLLKPVTLSVDESQIYVTQEASVYIYSLADLKLVRKFGQAGQGPQEFQVVPQIPLTLDVSTDRIIVISLGKVSHFKKNGDFIDETRTKGIALFLQPLGDRYIGMSVTQEDKINYRVVNLYDAEINRIKEVYRDKHNFQGPGNGLEVLPKPFIYVAYQDKILLPGADDATVEVFDTEMKKLFSITLDQPRIRVDQAFKDQVIEYLKTDPGTASTFEILKPIRFPEYFPTIARFFVDDDIIYVMTWRREGDINEFFAYDLKGRFLKKRMIPIEYQTRLQPYPITVRKSKLYQIVENEDEDWELHVSVFK